MSLLIKVCGLTRAEDAAFAAGQGADLLGFVCHPPSVRHCPDLSLAAHHADRAVLVMVAAQAEAILDTARRFGFRTVQPYLPTASRAAGVARLREQGLTVLLPWTDAPGQSAVAADLYLWEPDPAQTGLVGGSGQLHPMVFPPPGPFLLAGGLDAESLPHRVAGIPMAARSNLRGVDAASRLEASPGCKDPDKVARFIAAARTIELDLHRMTP